MANKIALLLLGGIVLMAVGAGAAIGLYLESGGGGDTPTPTPAGGEAATASTDDGGNTTGGNESTNTTATTGSPTTAPTAPTPTPTPTPTGTPRPNPVGPDDFDEKRIEELVREEINDRRAERGLDRLFVRDGMPRMARNHSERMSRQGFASHDAGGFSTKERYERNGFGCAIPDDTNTDTREGANIETVDKVSAGQKFDGRYNRNESQVAQDAVENWFSDDEERTKLLYENAGSLGVGVEVSGSGHAYITVDLCN